MKPWVLVAIIIVVLSVGVAVGLAQYDPLERSIKAQDARLQTAAGEFIQASVQYYSAHNGLPWFSAENNGAGCVKDNTSIPTVAMKSLSDCVNLMISERDLRRDYATPFIVGNLIITNPNPRSNSPLDTVVCYQPQSKNWQQDKNTKYNKNGSQAVGNKCISQGGKEACYWCTQ